MMAGDAVAVVEASRAADRDGRDWDGRDRDVWDLAGHPDEGGLPLRWLAGLAGLGLGLCILAGVLAS